MGYRLIIFTFSAIFCQAQTQLCANLPLQTSSPTIVVPQVIVDNSVSTALANALQLLIVSDIIESKLGANLLTNLLKINSIETPCCPRIEVAEYVTPCITPVEIVAPCRPVIETVVPIVEPIYNKPYGVIEPYPFLGCSEIVTPYEVVPCVNEIVKPSLSNVFLPEVITPRNCYGAPEILSPRLNLCNNCGVEVIAPICANEVVTVPSYCPSCFGGFNEIAPPCIKFTVTELATPCFGGLPELVKPIPSCNCGCFGNVPEIITPCNTFGGIPEIIRPVSPCNIGCGAPEIFSPISPCNIGCGAPDIFNPISPCSIGCGAPEIFSPISPCNIGCGMPEFIAPCSPCGTAEVIPPMLKPGCVGVPKLRPISSIIPCRAPEMITPCLNNIPEVILPPQCNTGCSCCEFCGPAAFSPSFCEPKEMISPIGPPFGLGIFI